MHNKYKLTQQEKWLPCFPGIRRSNMEITPDLERGRYSFMCVSGLEVALLKNKKKKKPLTERGGEFISSLLEWIFSVIRMAGYDPQRFKMPSDRENSNEWDMHIFNITSLSLECTKSPKASLRDKTHIYWTCGYRGWTAHKHNRKISEEENHLVSNQRKKGDKDKATSPCWVSASENKAK